MVLRPSNCLPFSLRSCFVLLLLLVLLLFVLLFLLLFLFGGSRLHCDHLVGEEVAVFLFLGCNARAVRRKLFSRPLAVIGTSQ